MREKGREGALYYFVWYELLYTTPLCFCPLLNIISSLIYISKQQHNISFLPGKVNVPRNALEFWELLPVSRRKKKRTGIFSPLFLIRLFSPGHE